MSHLYSMFAKEVSKYCKTNGERSVAKCKHDLLSYGLLKLDKMDESHLDEMDPYQRSATDICKYGNIPNKRSIDFIIRKTITVCWVLSGVSEKRRGDRLMKRKRPREREREGGRMRGKRERERDHLYRVLCLDICFLKTILNSIPCIFKLQWMNI